MSIRLNNRGDTIVEVLIAIAIVGMVIGGAYASANQSMHAQRRSQEHAEATHIAEQQLEMLKSTSQTNGDLIFAADRNPDFCLLSTTDAKDFNRAPNTSYLNDQFTLMPTGDYPSECTESYSNGTSSYYVWVHRDPDLQTFHVRVRWDGSGNLKQEVLISYRLHDETT